MLYVFFTTAQILILPTSFASFFYSRDVALSSDRILSIFGLISSKEPGKTQHNLSVSCFGEEAQSQSRGCFGSFFVVVLRWSKKTFSYNYLQAQKHLDSLAPL